VLKIPLFRIQYDSFLLLLQGMILKPLNYCLFIHILTMVCFIFFLICKLTHSCAWFISVRFYFVFFSARWNQYLMFDAMLILLWIKSYCTFHIIILINDYIIYKIIFFSNVFISVIDKKKIIFYLNFYIIFFFWDSFVEYIFIYY